MTFDEILRRRASTRRYSDRMPDDEAIRKILDAALLAPIVRMHKFHLSVVTSKEVMNYNLFWNVGSIIENMELQATELGLASCGINTTVVGMMDRPDVRKAVGIPDGYAALASVVVGYPVADLPERKVRPEFIPVSYVK